MLKILGKNPSGDLKIKTERSPNYNNGKFNNLTETVMIAKDAKAHQFISDIINAKKNREPATKIPSSKSNLNSLEPDVVSITWFGHSSYHIYINNKHILVDPVFSGHASPFSFMVKAFNGSDVYTADDFETIDILLLTHDHYDHLDYRTLLKLKEKVKAIYCSLGVASHLLYWGFNAAIINELDWWQTTAIGDLKLTATPARHFSGRTLKRAQSLWSSFVLQSEKHNLFLGGDSGYDKHFKEIGEKFKSFDIAILECGQYNEKWPMIHMTPEQTVQASLDLNAKVLFPVHWGKFALAYHPWNEPVKRLTKKAIEMNINFTTPLIGEQIIIGKHYPKTEWWNE
jgi:L-ascorbate metabolism protein UlaG (beta-lactamase superfamily)